MLDKPAGRGAAEAADRLTADDVVIAYRLFFGREPENKDVVASHVAHHKNLEAFRASVLKSQEFLAKFPKIPLARPLNWPAIKVEVDVPITQLAEMVRLVEGNWEALGQSEPHWSVLTNDKFKSDKISESEEEFYRSGKASADLMTAALARCGIDISSLETCLELGCGV